MKFALVFAAVMAVAAAQFSNFGKQPARYQPPRPASPPRPAPAVTRVSTSDKAASVLRYDNEVGPDGSYSYAVEIDNGIAAHARGTPRSFGGNPPVVAVAAEGAYSWTSPEGQPISITYVADENGFQPSGDALPTPPPIPAAILRALEYIAKNQK